MNKRGFTLIELLVVIVIIGILVAIALPNFIRIKDKAKEAEVKQNCHAIQLALERYAVDAPAGDYPMFPMGGDWTDSYVVWQDWVDRQQKVDPLFDPLKIEKYILSGVDWVAAPTDRGDSLVMEAYMPSYPGNPFVKTKSATILPTVQHHAFNDHIWTRYVGGRNSDKMVEIFGWQMTTGSDRPTGDFFVHHIFNNPPYLIDDLRKETTSSGDVDWNSPSGNSLLVGNFSYYPRPADEKGMFMSTQRVDCMGYTIAGYGSVRTAGQDVYNRNGNYRGRYRTENCEVDCSSSPFFGSPQDIGCICPPDDSAPSLIKNNGGSDTLADGVVVTLDSGVDKKSGRTNFQVTEGEF